MFSQLVSNPRLWPWKKKTNKQTGKEWKLFLFQELSLFSKRLNKSFPKPFISSIMHTEKNKLCLRAVTTVTVTGQMSCLFPCAYNTVSLLPGWSMLNDKPSPGNWWGLHLDPEQPLNSPQRALTITGYVSHCFPPFHCMLQFAPSHLHCFQIHSSLQHLTFYKPWNPRGKNDKKQQRQTYIFLPRLTYS